MRLDDLLMNLIRVGRCDESAGSPAEATEGSARALRQVVAEVLDMVIENAVERLECVWSKLPCQVDIASPGWSTVGAPKERTGPGCFLTGG